MVEGYIYAHHTNVMQARLSYRDRYSLTTNQTLQDIHQAIRELEMLVQLIHNSHKLCADNDKPTGHKIQQGNITVDEAGIPVF